MNLCLNVVEFKMFSIPSMKLATFQLIKIRFKKKKKVVRWSTSIPTSHSRVKTLAISKIKY